MAEKLSALLLLCYAVIGWALLRWAYGAPKPEQEPEPEEEPDFAFMTVREQVEAVRRTSDALQDLESLQDELTESTPDDILPVHLEWMSRDGTMHALEVYCDGTDTATESLWALADTEIHETKKALAYQCEVLAKHTRSRKNGRKNDFLRGGEDVEEVLRNVRGSHRDG